MIIPSTSSSSSRQPRVNLKTSYSTNAMMTNSQNWYAPSNLHVPPLNPNDPFLSKLASAAASFPEAFLNRPVNSDTPPYLDIYDSPTLMASPAQVERSVGYDDAELTTPPPDLPSILLHGRIVYIGMPVRGVTEMAFKPLDWYCHPVKNGIWAKIVDSAFGVYTPCAIDSLVVCITHLVLWGVCLYRIWLIKKSTKAQKFLLRSNFYNCMLRLLAGYCIAEPILRIVMNISIFNLDGQDELAPFEIVSLIIEALTWCSMLLMISLETKVYIREFRWYVRFAVMYILVGEAVMVNLILPVRDHYDRERFIFEVKRESV